MFHEKHLARAVEIQQWIAFHQNNIEVARRMPLTHSAWEDSDGQFTFAHEALHLAPAALHGILVAGVVADAEAQITALRDELQRLGVTMGGEGNTPAPRFVVLDQTPEPVTLPILAVKTARPKAVVKRMKKIVNGARHAA